MTPDLVQLKETLRRIVEAGTGINAIWLTGPRPQITVGQKALATLDVSDIRTVGTDERRQRRTQDQMLEHVRHGLRYVTVNVRFEDHLLCTRYGFLVMEAFSQERHRAALRALQTSVLDRRTARYQNVVQDEHMVELSAVPLVLLLAVEYTDQDPISWIELFRSEYVPEQDWYFAEHVSTEIPQGSIAYDYRR